MRLCVKLFLLLSLLGSLAVAELTFPKLSGRIVDEASLLSPAKSEALTELLKAHEEKTTNQVVIVTLKSLQGYEIEEYGYQLGRHWGVGQKGKDNGVLLIVAPNERKVRIEVGYGLEGVVTDKIAHDIVQEKILPSFKLKEYAKGIESGAYAILSALDGEYQITQEGSDAATSSGKEESNLFDYLSAGFFIIFFVAIIIEFFISKKKRSTRFYVGVGMATAASAISFFILWSIVTAAIVWIFTFIQIMVRGSRSGGSVGSSGTFSSRSSFSGGGGSFGGGGASGSW